MADIEAPRHLIEPEHTARQQEIATVAVDNVVLRLKADRNWLRNIGGTLASLAGTRHGINPETSVAANRAHKSTVKSIEINARKGAVDLTEDIGPGMPGPRNEAYIQRVSTRVADRFGRLFPEITTRALEDNRGLGIIGDAYRSALTYPGGTAFLGIGIAGLAGLGLYNASGDINVAAFGMRVAGEFLVAHGVIGTAKDALVNFHSRHARNLGAVTTPDLVRRAMAWNEQRIVNGDNYLPNDDENAVIGQATANIGEAVSQELHVRGASLPIVINTTVGVPETVAGISNALNEANPFQLWVEKMVQQRRARFIVAALAGASAIVMGINDIRNRPGFIGPIPVPTPIVIIYTPTATETRTPRPTKTSTPTSTATPRPTETPISTSTPERVLVTFVNPDNNYAPHNKEVSSLKGYAESLVANVDFDWKAKFGHEFNGSAEDMTEFNKLINGNRAEYDYRVRLYARKIKEMNERRGVIFGDEIDHDGTNAVDGIKGIFRPTNDALIQSR